MATPQSTAFTDERTEYESRQKNGETIVYTAALYLPQRVKPMCEELRQLTAIAEKVSIFNPFSSFIRLRDVRRKVVNRQKDFQYQLSECVRRMSEPVEGATSMELGWIQGFTFAAGISAFTDLNTSLSAMNETLDRKAAYSMACFSLYVAFVSLVATVVLGVMSLK